MDYKEYIEIDPNVRFGRPCLKGTSISVYDVLGWLASGMTIEEILVDFPQLTKEQILACLAYSADKESQIYVVIFLGSSPIQTTNTNARHRAILRMQFR